MTCGPLTRTSPPSPILMMVSFNAGPTVPGLIFLGLFPLVTGVVSVSPKPSRTLMPIPRKNSASDTESGPPPDMAPFNLSMPRASLSLENIILSARLYLNAKSPVLGLSLHIYGRFCLAIPIAQLKRAFLTGGADETLARMPAWAFS